MEGLDSPRKSTQLCSLCARLYLDSAAGSFEGPRKQIPLISLGVIIRYTLLPSDCPYGNKDPRVLLFKGQKNFHMNTDRKCYFFKKKAWTREDSSVHVLQLLLTEDTGRR